MEEEIGFFIEATDAGSRVRAQLTRRRHGPISSQRATEDLEADLASLVALLEEGQSQPPAGRSDTIFGTPAHDLRRVAYDLRAVPVSDNMVELGLDGRHASCEMSCVFCPRTASRAPRNLPGPTSEDQRRIAEAAARIGATWPGLPMALESDDPLRYPDLFGLLDRLGPRPLVIHTPGLALGDRAFAERFVGRDVRFDVTVHATDADVWTSMCGNREAMERVLTGLDHLGALGLRFDLSVVVTHRNVDVLARTLLDLAVRYRPEQISVRVFYPDASELGRAYGAQFPGYDRVVDQLARLVGADGPLPVLQLSNLPPCQVEPGRLDGLRLRWTPNRNALRTHDLPDCEGCPARERCCGIHPWYLATHPLRPPDRGAVQAALALESSGGTSPETPAIARHPLDDDGLAVLVVLPRTDDAPAWLVGREVVACYTLDARLEPRRRARLERALAAVREKVASLPPERLDAGVFARLADRVRQLVSDAPRDPQGP